MKPKPGTIVRISSDVIVAVIGDKHGKAMNRISGSHLSHIHGLVLFSDRPDLQIGDVIRLEGYNYSHAMDLDVDMFHGEELIFSTYQL